MNDPVGTVTGSLLMPPYVTCAQADNRLLHNGHATDHDSAVIKVTQHAERAPPADRIQAELRLWHGLERR